MVSDIDKYIKAMVQRNASDIHISAGSPVFLRIDEVLVPADETILTAENSKELIYSLLSNEQKEKFERELELDMSFGVKGLGRFRVNVFKQRGTISSSIRLIPHDIWSFEQCGLPAATVLDFCKRPKGLVLVTGATGSGKSTSLSVRCRTKNKQPYRFICALFPRSGNGGAREQFRRWRWKNPRLWLFNLKRRFRLYRRLKQRSACFFLKFSGFSDKNRPPHSLGWIGSKPIIYMPRIKSRLRLLARKRRRTGYPLHDWLWPRRFRAWCVSTNTGT